LLADPRISVRENLRRLGWADNFDQLAGEVTTPYFCLLPHDDIWAPTYLETMLAALAAQPRAILAYGDLLWFGATTPARKSVTLPPAADRVTSLFQFLLQGTEAMMCRGVTRTDALRRVKGFPTDRHKGFVVECEYALALLAAGRVCHVPRTLYFKRMHDARWLEAQGRGLEALERATEAMRIGHRNEIEEARQLLGRVYTSRSWQR